MQWIGEINHYCPDLPIVLAGLKADLRKDPGTILALAKENKQPTSYQEV
jgi:Ras family protein A